MHSLSKIQNSCRVQKVARMANIVLLKVKQKESKRNDWKSFCERMAITFQEAETMKKSRMSKVKIDSQQRHK
jgi:hypothetical protein